jgi:hypothetical protein
VPVESPILTNLHNVRLETAWHSTVVRQDYHASLASFVTISLANDKTEACVMDRTGHKTSGMVKAYRQAARSAKELGLGQLLPLDEAIPELAKVAAKERLAGSGLNPPKDDGAEKSA